MKPIPFSIVIPTFDRSHLLRRAIASVFAQSFQGFEIMVVDDASPRPVDVIVDSFRDERLTLVRQPVNRGNAAARNEGIMRAQGEWIVFLDDDDELMPRYLERMRVAIGEARPRADWGWCGAVSVDESVPGRERSRPLWNPRYGSRHEAYLGFLAARKIGTCGLCVRRSCFGRVGLFDERLRGAVDTDFLIRMARLFPFTVVPEPLVRIHQHGGPQVRRHLDTQARAYRRIAAKHSRTLRDHPEVGARVYYKVAWLQYHAGERRWGRAYLLRSIRRRPGALRSWVALAGFELFGSLARPAHVSIARWKKRLASRGAAPS